MSWLARSIANSLNFDDENDDDVNAAQKLDPEQLESPGSQNEDIISPSRGVKEDLSEISKTLTRQLWGVASFLAPPPQPDQNAPTSNQSSILGIRSDFSEIGGKFRSGISRLTNNINVSEITKLASNLLQLESDDDNDGIEKTEGFDSLGKGAVGVSEDVVAFARDIAMHPETWLDFPLTQNVGDDADFDLSDAQQEHALSVERLAPRLAALRIELCPEHMSESCFWKIYFVLLHPRLKKQAAELLSTPQVKEARAILVHELKKRNSTTPEHLSGKKNSDPEEMHRSCHEEPISAELVIDSVEEKETQIVDKPVMLKSKKPLLDSEEQDEDDWLKEETSEVTGEEHVDIPIENEDDVSFSDLEDDDDDDGDVQICYRKSNYSSDKDSRDWVQCSSDKESGDLRGDTKESNDWSDFDDIVVP